ncbi:MAG: dodecin domain-containing protein [Deltaproteobacteria bacterium]|nr:dodecin domain-containing protein [Deltaproteobacteria bacterium]
MANPFERAEATKRGLGGLRRSGSVTLEGIEDLLARAASVREVTQMMISTLCDERRVDLRSRLARGRKQLYRRYLSHCFEDKVLSESERADLAHLRSLLHLSAADLSAIHDEVAIEVYGEAVDEVLEDFRLDDDEAEFLRGLRAELGLTDESAEQIYREGSFKARSRALTQAESRDRQFIEHHAPAGEFTGRSDEMLEGAIEDALAKAALAIPQLHWFEVTELAGYVSDGKTSSWHVTLRAGISKGQS